MRSLLLLALLTAAGCSLGMAGLGADPLDADATGGHDAGATPSSDDSGGDIDAHARPDSGSADISSTLPGDAAGGADASTPLDDAGAGNDGDSAARPPPSDAGSDGDFDVASPPSDADIDGDAAAPVDSGDAAPDAHSAGDDGSSCSSAIPSGWSLVIYDLGANMCPVAFPAHDAFGQPTIGAAACSCTCGVTQSGNCTQGTLSTYGNRSTSSSCPQAWLSATLNDTACTTLPALPPAGPVPLNFQASPFPAQGGTCSGALQSDPTQVSAPSARYCDVPAASADSVCNGVVPTGFAACIATSGVTTCPSATPFMHTYSVEDATTLQCSACSACMVTTTCSNAVLTAYTDPSCAGAGIALSVDGTCAGTGAQGRPLNVSAVRYAATAHSTCMAGSSTPTAQLTNPRTICCR